ncbi:hypothetical protein SLNWT_2574 [Streptomyces albus]|uniref:Uncharacterized protein n=1 Tax=Streptomyces albus (strain ATCC 21838 / DSM 41398 / FERM P-419 / JCM 4703 / NBRC 107858) TaxID=1081613 RepID=A0A0B5EUP2_STRA4|nr:hypothetical protein SLNWT_2574 [Streptomyces albus]AOU77262.1 hypothetical protein SLNHY_2571 [Streptomyces albus]AYN33038.1 hypothetical protein DUI70_2536 [Streptomyces albus]
MRPSSDFASPRCCRWPVFGRTTRVKLQVCDSERVKPGSAIEPVIHSAEPS